MQGVYFTVLHTSKQHITVNANTKRALDRVMCNAMVVGSTPGQVTIK